MSNMELKGLAQIKEKLVILVTLKLSVVRSMRENHLSLFETAVRFGIPNDSVVLAWDRLYELEGATALSQDNRGKMKKPRKHKQPTGANPVISAQDNLLEELEYLRAENAYLKKFEGLSRATHIPRERERAQAIEGLRPHHRLSVLLKVAGMARSTFYYQLKQSKLPDKYTREKEELISVFHEHKGRYGHRRITVEMKNRGYVINHKTIIKLMKICGIKCQVRLRKYRSYRGETGKIAPEPG